MEYILEFFTTIFNFLNSINLSPFLNINIGLLNFILLTSFLALIIKLIISYLIGKTSLNK